MPNDIGFVPSATRADVVDVALAGLSASPKTLPAKLFYDEDGCRLFYEITRLPEYYLTRTETSLLRSVAPAVASKVSHNAVLVEFGGSEESKARILLDLPHSPFATYVPIDVAALAMSEMKDRLRQSNPGLEVVPVVGDFMQPLRLPALAEARLGFFPGSTIGNLDPAEATRFLLAAKESLGAGSWFLLGADLRKSPGILLPAYNDSAGVTAAFNLNMLRRLNREAAADFDLDKFRHEAVWNDAESRIEMHLFARVDQTVHLAGQAIRFREGESIHTENSYKHRQDRIGAIARQAGWTVDQSWTDRDGLFGLFLLRA